MCRIICVTLSEIDLEKGSQSILSKTVLVQLFPERLDASMMLLHFAIILPLFLDANKYEHSRAGLTLIESTYCSTNSSQRIIRILPF